MKSRTPLRFLTLSLLGGTTVIACGETRDDAPGASSTTSAPTTSASTPAPATGPGVTAPANTSSVAPGPTGPSGPTGPLGPSGPSGATEPTASTETSGPTGSTSPTGPTSATATPSTSQSEASSEPSPDETSDTDSGPSPLPAGGYPENTGAGCEVVAGELTQNSKLPDPFSMNDGSRISTKAEWPCRRNEIKKDIERYEIGTKPEPPMVEASVAGGKLNVVVTTDAGSITLSSTVGNASGSGPHCVAIGMNGNSSLINGCVQVPFMHDQVVGYNQNGNKSQNDPFYKVYPDAWGKVANYTAWSWGISRLIDGLEQVKTELDIDMSRIGVHGCSYAGKMALFGGAFDERVALTIAQESGGGGINSWRLSDDFAKRGTDIEKIDNTNYSWFLQSMKQLDPYELPHDHHELIAMIAPRAVIALGNKDYEWLGDESGYKSMMAAKEVWKAFGAEENIGFDFTADHRHCQAAQSQVSSVNAFVDKFLKGKDANTNIAIEPPSGGFDLDYTKWVDWETVLLQ